MKQINDIKEAWYYIYGKGSHMNIFGKIILGAPCFPMIAAFVLTLALLEFLFSKDPVK